MPQCARAAAAPLASLLFLLAAAATAEACVFYTHERSIIADLPFSSFSLPPDGNVGTITTGAGPLISEDQALLLCAQHAAAFNVSAASIGTSLLVHVQNQPKVTSDHARAKPLAPA